MSSDVPHVSVSWVIERLVKSTFKSLMELSEELLHVQNADRKNRLIEYCISTRRKYAKLLILLRWIKENKNVYEAQRAIAWIESKDAKFASTADVLFKLHQDMKTAKEPQFDVVNAIDVLATGRYKRLPTIIEKSFLDKPTQNDKPKLIMALHDVIRSRLRHDVLPASFRRSMQMKNGHLIFKVHEEMTVELTLHGVEASEPWIISNIHFDFLDQKTAKDILDVELSSTQIENIRNLAQAKLNQVKKSEIEFLEHLKESSMDISSANATMSDEASVGAGASLLELYDFLHLMSLKLKLLVLHTQAKYLKSSRWKDLTLEFDQSLTLSYWDKNSQTGASLIEGAPQKAQESVGDSTIIFSIQSIPNTILINKMGHSSRKEMMVWSQIHASQCEIFNRKLVISYKDPSQSQETEISLSKVLNLESILLEFAQRHAGHLIHQFKNILTKHQESFSTSIEFSAEDLKQVENKLSPCLYIKYHPRWQLKLSVHLINGRLVLENIKTEEFLNSNALTDNSASKDTFLLKNTLLQYWEDMINTDMTQLVPCLKQLRYRHYLEHLSILYIYFNVESLWKLPVAPFCSLAQVFDLPNEVVQQSIYYQIKENPSYYLMMTVHSIDANNKTSRECTVKYSVSLLYLHQPSHSAYQEIIQHIKMTPQRVNSKVPTADSVLQDEENTTKNEFWTELSLSNLTQIISYSLKLIRHISFVSQIRAQFGMDYRYVLTEEEGRPSQSPPGFLMISEYLMGAANPVICIPSTILSRRLLSRDETPFSKSVSGMYRQNQVEILQDVDSQGLYLGDYSSPSDPFGDLFVALIYKKSDSVLKQEPTATAYIRVFEPITPLIQTIIKGSTDESLCFNAETGFLTVSLQFSPDCFQQMLKMIYPLLRSGQLFALCPANQVSVRADGPSKIRLSVSISSASMLMGLEVTPNSICICFEPDPQVKTTGHSFLVDETQRISGTKSTTIQKEAKPESNRIQKEAVFMKQLEKHVHHLVLKHQSIQLALGYADWILKFYFWVQKPQFDEPVCVRFMSLNTLILELETSNIALRVVLSRSFQWVSFVDASFSVFSVKDMNEKKYDCIPGFAESIRDPMQPTKLLYFSFISRFKEQMDMLSQLSPMQGTYVLVPEGVMMDIALTDAMLTLLSKHVRIMNVMTKLEKLALDRNGFGMEKVKADVATMRVAYMARHVLATIGLNANGALYMKMKLKPGTQEEAVVSANDLAEFEGILNEKLKRISLHALSVEWLSFLIDLSLLPLTTLKELIQISLHKESNEGQCRVNWILQSDLVDKTTLEKIQLEKISEKNPLERTLEKNPLERLSEKTVEKKSDRSMDKNTDTASLPCCVIELDLKRISLLFQFSNRSAHSVVLALRYNYGSGVLGLWNKKERDHDLTWVPSDSPFLHQKLAALSAPEALNACSMTEKVLMIASTRVMSVKNGGPGKLYPVMNALMGRSLEELRS